MPAGRWRYRFWVNRRLVEDYTESNPKLDAICTDVSKMRAYCAAVRDEMGGTHHVKWGRSTSMSKDYAGLILTDLAGLVPPYASGNNPRFLAQIVFEETGRKIPLGDADRQIVHGERSSLQVHVPTVSELDGRRRKP